MLKKIKKFIRQFLPNSEKEIIPVIRFEGVIGTVKSMGRKGLCLETVKEAIDEAFDEDRADIIAIVMNSPGGSPVQSSLIYNYLLALKTKKQKKIMVFVEDVAASGGYYIACAGDEIYTDAHSIIGSIGVVSGGFGFDQAIEKIGVERRVYTSGTSKAMLDPFLPENKTQVAHLKSLQEEVHQGFKDVVSEARQGKLQEDKEKDLFSGKFWAGKTAHELGLTDGIASLDAKMTEIFGDDYKLIPIKTDKRGLLEKYVSLHAESTISEVRGHVHELMNTRLS